MFSVVSYKTSRHRLGDEILHREQLIDVELDYSSPSKSTEASKVVDLELGVWESASICAF